jgi:hypothetical protein
VAVANRTSVLRFRSDESSGIAARVLCRAVFPELLAKALSLFGKSLFKRLDLFRTTPSLAHGGGPMELAKALSVVQALR